LAHLFLFDCAKSLAWGQKAYSTIIQFQYGLQVTNLLRVTLESCGNSASENLQRETQQPKCCLYETPYIAAPVRETGDVIARTPLYARLPTDAPTRTRFFFGSQVTSFSRDPSRESIGSYVPFLRGSHIQKQYHRRTTLRT
jgi:hypothetical protein